MEQQQLLMTLDLATDTRITLVAMRHVIWGRDLYFTCVADTLAFELHFLDCRDSRWQLYTHMQHDDQPAFPQTELANLKIGRDQHRSPAHLLTQHFGLSLVYGALQLHTDGRVSYPGR